MHDGTCVILTQQCWRVASFSPGNPHQPYSLKALMRNLLKALARSAATIAVTHHLISFWLRAWAVGPDRALLGSSQILSLIPGLTGQYLRRAFYTHVLAECHRAAAIEFGVLFSRTGARIGENAYIGPYCQIGLAHIERNVLLASAVHIPSGPMIHGIGDVTIPVREQPGTLRAVKIREGTWVGSGAVIMADVGRHSVIGAGSVVTKPIPDYVIAGGVPAKVIRSRTESQL